MTDDEAMDKLRSVQDDVLRLFYESNMRLMDISLAVGMPRRRALSVSQFLKEVVGQEAFVERSLRVKTEGQKSASIGHVGKMCGDCRSFAGENKRTAGYRMGRCIKTGQLVERCTWCQIPIEKMG